MTENELAVEEVRRALGERTNARGFRLFSKSAAALAVQYAKKRLSGGASAREVAGELGLIGWTLQRWLQREQRGDIKPTGSFVRLEVTSVPPQAPVVHGPCGVRVEGLGLEGIAALMRSLSCSG